MVTPLLADPFDPRRTASPPGLLGAFHDAGLLDASDLHVAARLGSLAGEAGDSVLLATALAVRAARLGSVCLDLAAAPHQIVPELEAGADPASLPVLPWPEPEHWAAVLAASPLVDAGPGRTGGMPLQLAGGLLYLDRYWRQEQLVAQELTSRASRSGFAPPPLDPDRFDAALLRLFPPAEDDENAMQREAASSAARRWLTVLAGGPGTGKTTTVARVLALLCDQPGPTPHIALAAPTGKAAARLTEAVRDAIAQLPDADQARLSARGLSATTLHRLLGFRPGSRSRFRHHAGNRLSHDVVVVDESSMISLTLMARLLDAVRPDARLVLVGDPEQLASVEAGAVLGDIVDAAADTAALSGIDTGIVVLERSWRFKGQIAELARAIQAGDADSVLAVLHTPAADVSFVEADPVSAGGGTGAGPLAGLREDVVSAARRLMEAARIGDASAALTHLGAHRLLCAHRQGPYGADRWGTELERWIDAAMGVHRTGGEWYPGRPLLVTANDYEVQLFNGDTGVIVSDGEEGVTAAFGRPADPVLVRPARLGAVQTMQAMTVHRSQGSQFERVSVLLPAEGSPLLTRQLLYTAVTRAERHVRVIATEAAVRAAVATPIARASGLRSSLWSG